MKIERSGNTATPSVANCISAMGRSTDKRAKKAQKAAQASALQDDAPVEPPPPRSLPPALPCETSPLHLVDLGRPKTVHLHEQCLDEGLVFTYSCDAALWDLQVGVSLGGVVSRACSVCLMPCDLGHNGC